MQCNQTDCQYVDENKPPCPLTTAMFADEIKAAEEARAANRVVAERSSETRRAPPPDQLTPLRT